MSDARSADIDEFLQIWAYRADDCIFGKTRQLSAEDIALDGSVNEGHAGIFAADVICAEDGACAGTPDAEVRIFDGIDDGGIEIEAAEEFSQAARFAAWDDETGAIFEVARQFDVDGG